MEPPLKYSPWCPKRAYQTHGALTAGVTDCSSVIWTSAIYIITWTEDCWACCQSGGKNISSLCSLLFTGLGWVWWWPADEQQLQNCETHRDAQTHKHAHTPDTHYTTFVFLWLLCCSRSLEGGQLVAKFCLLMKERFVLSLAAHCRIAKSNTRSPSSLPSEFTCGNSALCIVNHCNYTI